MKKIRSFILSLAAVLLLSAFSVSAPVSAAPASKVVLKEKTLTIEAGKSKTIGIKKKLPGDKIVKCRSSNPKVAVVTSKGKVTARKKGTAQITVTMKSGAKATCKIKVTKSSKAIAYVWVPRTGARYHKSSKCSNMKSPKKVTVTEAKEEGYTPCKKCYK